MSDELLSWGRYPRVHHEVQRLYSRFDAPAAVPGRSYLAYGMGRSYGDVCLNDGNALLLTRGMDRFVSLDRESGVLECEAGVTLAEITQLVLPLGWFLPVTPGTKYVTVGGAIANDVHGKNHHRAGTFGCHVLGFELLRSDGTVLNCTPVEQTAMFAATIGGLGLTGLIRRARIQLRKVPGPWLKGESVRFANLREFFSLARESDEGNEYTVAWVDCLARGNSLGRGLFMRGNHAALDQPPPRNKGALRMPFTPPFSLVNSLSLRLFNQLYYARQWQRQSSQVWHYEPFFYPLDGILEWNRMYGPRGFFQYQCVVPMRDAEAGIAGMLERIAASGMGSFLAVLKLFGDRTSPGLLSFPRAGATLALDFPNQGERTLRLLDELDVMTTAAGGAVYPAKDARMSASAFRRYFSRLDEFRPYVDPAFSSSFWRRVQQ